MGRGGGVAARPSRPGQRWPSAWAGASSIAPRKCRATRSRVTGSGAARSRPSSAQLERSGATQVVKFRSPTRPRTASQTRAQTPAASFLRPGRGGGFTAPPPHPHLWRHATLARARRRFPRPRYSRRHHPVRHPDRRPERAGRGKNRAWTMWGAAGGCAPADQASIGQPELACKKKNHVRSGVRMALLVGDLAPGEELEVGDQLTHRRARLARVAAQLPLELEAAAVAQRAVAELHVGALHVAAPVEEPVDLGEREQAHALLGQLVGDREQARKEPGVVAPDLLGETRVDPHDEQAEGRLELAQRRLDLPLPEVRVAACSVRQAALETGALEGGERRHRQRPGEEYAARPRAPARWAGAPAPRATSTCRTRATVRERPRLDK